MEKFKNHIQKYRNPYLATVLIVLIIGLIFLGYKKGYRFTENFMLGKAGTLSLQIAMPLTNVFIDENNKIITNKDNETVEVSLSPRNHTVIVSREGYFPWKKDIEMQSEGNINFKPVLVSSNPSGNIITKEDPEFWKLRNQIITDALPTKESPRLSKDGKAKLWIEDNGVMVETDNKIYTVIQPEPEVRNLYFYKDRNDVLIFSINNAVYAIEVDKTGTQNFLPIYKGLSPSFIEGDNSFIYVLDGEALMQVFI